MTALSTPRLTGYRAAHRDLLSGPWLPGEAVGLPLAGWPPLAPPHSVPEPPTGDAELYVLPDAGFVRFADLDWVHRRARLEIGLRAGAQHLASEVLRLAVAHGLEVLDLHRLSGWFTAAGRPCADLLTGAGFVAELTVPGAIWFDGRPVDRTIMAVVS